MIEEQNASASAFVTVEDETATPLERELFVSVADSLGRPNNPVSLRAAELARTYRERKEGGKKR